MFKKKKLKNKSKPSACVFEFHPRHLCKETENRPRFLPPAAGWDMAGAARAGPSFPSGDARAQAVALPRAGRTVPGCDGHPPPLPERIRGATAGIAVHSLICSCGGRKASKEYKIISLKPFLFNRSRMMHPPVSHTPAMYPRLHKCAHPRMSRLRNVPPLLP